MLYKFSRYNYNLKNTFFNFSLNIIRISFTAILEYIYSGIILTQKLFQRICIMQINKISIKKISIL